MTESPPPNFTPASRWHPLVISVIAALCSVFLTLSCYRILKRSRTEREDFNEENPGESSLQFHSCGLDSSIAQGLPTVEYKKKKNEGDTEHGEMECAVCLGDFEVGDLLRFLPNCAHSFHVACVDTWFKSHSNCPLCRSNVLHDGSDHRSYSASLLTSVETHRREDVAAGSSSSHELLQDSTICNHE